MKDFIIKTIVSQDIVSELEKIGFDDGYKFKASDKYCYKTLKIFDLSIPQANILKQAALSIGADCAVHREVLVNNIDMTDVILGGSISQLKKISEKLKFQPFSLNKISELILGELEPRKSHTKIVGILNVTPDSFSDGGLYLEKNAAIKQLYQLIEDGADMIDIGAESTRPFSEKVSSEEQIKRLSCILKEIKNITIPVSVDTRNSEVAKFALDNGVKFINDVSGLMNDEKLVDVVSEYDAGLIIQHSAGLAEEEFSYDDIIDDVYKFLYEKAALADSKGIKNIVLDVGIGFSKTKEHNYEILKRIEEFYSLKYPLMVGVSRKKLLGVNEDNNILKDSLTLALNYPLIQKGIDYIRVHNVKLHKQLLSQVI